jgi:hypothetical protein
LPCVNSFSWFSTLDFDSRIYSLNMRDEESYATDGKEVIDGPYEKDMEKPLDASKLEPFGNEETAEVKYRTMKWW